MAASTVARFRGSHKFDLTGRRFGRLLVTEYAGVTVKGKRQWCCRCDCGREHIATACALKGGNTKSCGCFRAHKTHGLAGTVEYKTWHRMMARCYNPESRGFERYGGRGIEVDQRWWRFENFISDMGNRPPSMTLERIDNDGPYARGNCRWATAKEQAHNRCSNRRLAHNGETMTLAAWSDRIGLHRETIRSRLRLGWPVATALTKPVR